MGRRWVSYPRSCTDIPQRSSTRCRELRLLLLLYFCICCCCIIICCSSQTPSSCCSGLAVLPLAVLWLAALLQHQGLGPVTTPPTHMISAGAALRSGMAPAGWVHRPPEPEYERSGARGRRAGPALCLPVLQPYPQRYAGKCKVGELPLSIHCCCSSPPLLSSCAPQSERPEPNPREHRKLLSGHSQSRR